MRDEDIEREVNEPARAKTKLRLRHYRSRGKELMRKKPRNAFGKTKAMNTAPFVHKPRLKKNLSLTDSIHLTFYYWNAKTFTRLFISHSLYHPLLNHYC